MAVLVELWAGMAVPVKAALELAEALAVLVVILELVVPVLAVAMAADLLVPEAPEAVVLAEMVAETLVEQAAVLEF